MYRNIILNYIILIKYIINYIILYKIYNIIELIFIGKRNLSYSLRKGLNDMLVRMFYFMRKNLTRKKNTRQKVCGMFFVFRYR